MPYLKCSYIWTTVKPCGCVVCPEGSRAGSLPYLVRRPRFDPRVIAIAADDRIVDPDTIGVVDRRDLLPNAPGEGVASPVATERVGVPYRALTSVADLIVVDFDLSACTVETRAYAVDPECDAQPPT